MISIIDYGAGNIGSIVNMIRKIGMNSQITSDPDTILKAKKLILPGVGHFDYGMNKLIESGLIDVLNKKVLIEKCPILGICLGAQLMTQRSDEGVVKGLGWFDAEVKYFSTIDSNVPIRIPHMGWNYVEVVKDTPLSSDLYEESRYYFVHSYYMQARNESDILFKTNYGNVFASGLNRDNIYAVQFHPEKSHKFGLKLFQNFLKL